ncbi:MAG: heme o synthase [Vicinamibacterales bacterium]
MKSETWPLATTRSRAADFVALTKPRLNMLVLATAAVGYYLGDPPPLDVVRCLHAVIGTALVAGGSAAFNQAFEPRHDALMMRTRLRPVPDGRVGVGEALVFATVLSIAGLAELALGTNLLTAGVALVTLGVYVVVYTPLKSRTAFSTVVGAIPGALPPMIGWTAATGVLSREAWILFGVVFLWQLPHFLAIAWMFRDDYARAGFPLLPVVERDGRTTAYQVMTYASALLPVSLLPTLVGLAGRTYFMGALALGVALLAVAMRFAFARNRVNARLLFFASIVYLPLIFGLMTIDATWL